MVAPGQPTLSYGLRGIAACEVILRGPARDLHSGIYGGAIRNPATEIARLVATFHDADGRVQVEGFYDDVKPLEEWEREMWSKLPGTGDEDFLRYSGASKTHGELAARQADFVGQFLVGGLTAEGLGKHRRDAAHLGDLVDHAGALRPLPAGEHPAVERA